MDRGERATLEVDSCGSAKKVEDGRAVEELDRFFAKDRVLPRGR